MSKPRGQIVPVHARYDQAVDIHWRQADGSIYVERRNAPLLPITDATWTALVALNDPEDPAL